MFTTEDVLRLIQYLGLPVDSEQISLITARLAVLQALSPYLTTQIQNDLLLLDELDELLQAGIGIKRADIVEFDVLQRVMGLITRSIQVIRRIAAKLKVEPDLSALQEQIATLTGRTDDPITIDKVRG